MVSSKTRLNSSSSEDDAYILLHPSGASAGTLGYMGDSGFEDVQPLQRLDQEVKNDPGVSSEPESKHNCCYVILLSVSLDRGLILYIVLHCQFSIFYLLTHARSIKRCVYEWQGVGNGIGLTPRSIILKY